MREHGQIMLKFQASPLDRRDQIHSRSGRIMDFYREYVLDAVVPLLKVIEHKANHRLPICHNVSFGKLRRSRYCVFQSEILFMDQCDPGMG